MPGYAYDDYGLTPMDMQALGISGEAMPDPMSQAGDYRQNQGDIWGQPYADIPASKGFDWPMFLSLLLKSGGAGAKRSMAGTNMAPKLSAGPVAHTQGGGRRRAKPAEVSQYQPMKLADFNLRGLTSLIPRNPLVSR